MSLAASGCALVARPHRPLRLAPSEPRARVIETSIPALADPAVRGEVRGRCVEVHPEFTLAFVEFDDQGHFWNREELDLLERTLEAENRRSDSSGIAVLFFAHGWRHDSEVCDENVACFRTLLAQARADANAVAKRAGGRVLPKRIVAVYAGWRGLSVNVQPFEDLSFWARKRVAFRIGNGDLIELLARLDLFVRLANRADPDRARLVIIGHSLGGTMVYSALANILKTRALEALHHQESGDSRDVLIQGFGDLVLLINPGFEASLYSGLHEIARRFRRFSPLQSPVLVMVASETDGPSSFWFPLGRWFETLAEYTGAESPRRALVTAVGNYQEFWTHRLTSSLPPAAGRTRKDSFGTVSKDCSCKLALEPIGEAEAGELLRLIRGERGGAAAPGAGQSPCAAPVPYGRASLSCVKPIDPLNPFWVVRASDEVVRGHSGIFTTPLMDFIRRLVIEAGERKHAPA